MGGIILIRIANADDAKRIAEMAEKNSLNRLENEDTGFLISGYTPEDYRRYIKSGNILVVEEKDGRDNIKAFTMVITSDGLDKNSIVNNELLKIHKSKFLLIKQICVDTSCKQRGYGRMLYSYIADSYIMDTFTAIVMEPINKASVKFHKDMGFVKAFEIIPEDGIKRHIYFRGHDKEKRESDLISS